MLVFHTRRSFFEQLISMNEDNLSVEELAETVDALMAECLKDVPSPSEK